MGKCANFSKI